MKPTFNIKKKTAMFVHDSTHFAILSHLVTESDVLFRYNTEDVIAYKAELERADMCYEEVILLNEHNMTVTIKVTPFQSIPVTLRESLNRELMCDISIGNPMKKDCFPPPICLCSNRLVAYEKIDLNIIVEKMEQELLKCNHFDPTHAQEHRRDCCCSSFLPSVEDFDRILDRLLTALEEICQWLDFTINRAVLRDIGDDEYEDAWYEDCSDERKIPEKSNPRTPFSDIEEDLPY